MHRLMMNTTCILYYRRKYSSCILDKLKLIIGNGQRPHGRTANDVSEIIFEFLFFRSSQYTWTISLQLGKNNHFSVSPGLAVFVYLLIRVRLENNFYRSDSFKTC